MVESRFIEKTCKSCGERFVIWVSREDFLKYHCHGVVNFPYLDAGQREILISGTCGRCFDLLFEADCVS